MDHLRLPDVIGSDDRVLGIDWSDEGLTLTIRVRAFDRAGTSGAAATIDWRITCNHVKGLRIDFDFGIYSGYPFLWDVLESNENGATRIEMRFGAAPEGALAFECSSYSIRPEQDPSTA